MKVFFNFKLIFTDKMSRRKQLHPCKHDTDTAFLLGDTNLLPVNFKNTLLKYNAVQFYKT